MIQNEEDVEKFKHLKPSPDRAYNAPQHATYKWKLSLAYEDHIGDWEDLDEENVGIEGSLFSVVC